MSLEKTRRDSLQIGLLALSGCLSLAIGCSVESVDRPVETRPSLQASPVALGEDRQAEAQAKEPQPAPGENQQATAAEPEKSNTPVMGETVQEKERATRQKLQAVTSMEFVDTPLDDVMEYFARQHGMEFLINELALKSWDIKRDQPVTIQLKEVTLATGLRHILQPLGLTFVIEEEAVLITSVHHADSNLKQRVYPVRDLMQYQDADDGPYEESEYLLELIVESLRTHTWDWVGGPGSLREKNGILTISQTDEILKDVELLLATLRKLPVIDSKVEEPSAWIFPLVEDTPQSQKVQAALQKPVPVEFIQTPLGEVVEYLRSATGLQILVDQTSLKKDSGVELSTQVTLKTKTLSLRSALRLMLRNLNAQFIVQDGILVITSESAAEAQPDTVVYDIRDLLQLPEEPEPEDVQAEIEEIASYVKALVRPESWSSVGGYGQMKGYFQRGALVVTTTEEVQEGVEKLLAQMKKVNTQQEPAAEESRSRLDQMEIVIYELMYSQPPINEKSGLPEAPAPKHIDTEKLVEIIPELLGPEVWGNDDQVMIRALEDRVVVRHTARVQRKILRLFWRLGVGIAGRGPGTGAMHGFGGESASGRAWREMGVGGGMSGSEGGGVFNVKQYGEFAPAE